MGQFKPMVKMETTEPSVELKLKKGGHVDMKKGGMAKGGHKKMAGGGAMEMLGMTPAFVGRPAVNAPVKSPGKPSMSARRKAMAAKKPAMPKKRPMPMPMSKPKDMAMMPPMMPSDMPPMKKGGKAETSKMKGLEKELKSHESKPASKGHKGLKTGGVANANAGGYKKGGMMGGGGMHMMPDGKMMKDSAMKKGGKATGGVANSNAGGYKDGGMPMKDGKPAFVGDGKGKMKSGGKAMMMGGYATGGVSNSNAGGFKHGGKTSKKAFATGGTVNTGKPVAMQEGNKPIPAPKRQQNHSGTYKNGGGVENQSLVKINNAQNAPAMRASKADTNLKYPETMNSPQKTPRLK